MKAKEVLEKFKISRNTLCNWVKKGWIKVETTPSGRYIYILDEKIQKNNEDL
jgi:predicted site-specific integrase-resolvase